MADGLVTTAISDIGMISADSHVNEPRDLWSSNLPASLRSQAMRGIEAGDDGGWNLVLDGKHIFQKDMNSEEDRLSVLDPEKRFEVMQVDGIVAECIFPSIGLYVWMLTDPDGGRESCRIYNDWIYDTIQRKSARFACAGLIPCWNPADAVAEVEHVAALGLRAVMLPAVANPMWNHRDWEPLWQAITATGLPVVMHQGTGHNMVWYRGPGATITNLIATQSMAPRVATMLATSGVLDRYPDMHVVFIEFNTGWLAWTMETMDYYDVAFRRYDTFKLSQSGKASIYPDLPHPPSYYVKRQVHSTFQFDAVGIDNIHRSGDSCLMWGSDYPHEEGTYPHSRKLVDELAATMDDAVARRVFRENALRVFNFDLAVIDAPF
ncbi:MAG TPA: amidohydrolase family protein [Ilumatobacteraceae bacterium]|nr:amidohydrolase family protein [Ilumatobacteraceae bacterium]